MQGVEVDEVTDNRVRGEAINITCRTVSHSGWA